MPASTGQGRTCKGIDPCSLINMRQAHGRHARRASKIAITRQPTMEWCCIKSHFSATNKAQGGDWPGGSWLPTNPEALPERGTARRLNPPTPGLATEETIQSGNLKTPWKHLTQQEFVPHSNSHPQSQKSPRKSLKQRGTGPPSLPEPN
ncbi:hypothetical protein E2C01_084889 [Portunus trituberculatus]|uniref:Uncharacterized protein n=1 Tax=Portunus trituberculatus TaxID=210409 RepID=A0A5B7J570_PORTR|nr:hypothetical protein [Portunus trituberculatus]